MVSLNGRKKEHFRVQAGCGADERRNILSPARMCTQTKEGTFWSPARMHLGTRPQQLFFFEVCSDCTSNFVRYPRGLAYVATICDRDWISLACGCLPQERQLRGPRVCRARAASFFACSCRANANVGSGSHGLTPAGFRPKPLLPRNFVQLGSCCLERMVVRCAG